MTKVTQNKTDLYTKEGSQQTFTVPTDNLLKDLNMLTNTNMPNQYIQFYLTIADQNLNSEYLIMYCTFGSRNSLYFGDFRCIKVLVK